MLWNCYVLAGSRAAGVDVASAHFTMRAPVTGCSCQCLLYLPMRLSSIIIYYKSEVICYKSEKIIKQ
ncbi:hypothetical protein DRN79_04800 [Methanosarcinales archaeon]|nr:MAG: hypothetical protein DRN79_04800 [Methanosarcinales archaeon]